MSVVASLIADMVRAGVDPDLIGRTAATIASAARCEQAPRTARQERNARYYQKKSSESRLNSDNQDDSDGAPKENTPIPPKENTPPKPPKGGISPQAELSTVLDADRAKAVIEHRQRLRKPLTPRAAHLLAEKFGRTINPNAAADLMIEKGWQSIEPDWCRDLKPPNTPAVEDPEKRWLTRLKAARRRGQWSAEWGPAPGQPGSIVPKHLLQPGDGEGWREWQSEAA